ncbi:MAG TPA: LysM peptidoglycan-binding domain-containing protein [bacterium]
MRGTTALCAGLLAAGALAGCRTTTRVVEMPRVDLEVSGQGNRGFLIGSAPSAADVKRTREMIETTFELPTTYRPTVQPRPIEFPPSATASPDAFPPADAAPRAPVPAGAFDTYVVRPGDTLWTIAAKPEIYGKATRWRDIFEANRDVLETPDSLQAGMELRIPLGAAPSSSAPSGPIKK